MADKPQSELRTESQIKVREVTEYQITWTERERGAPGAFTIQLVLDHGVEEYVTRPTAEDAEVLVQMFSGVEKVYFDLERKALMFGSRPVSG